MLFKGPRSSNSRHLFLSVIVIITCSFSSFARKPRSNTYLQGSRRLTISSVGPGSGPTTGGTTVAVTGTGFTHSASVLFGGVPAVAVAYVSSTQLLATSPAHASGTVSIAAVESPHNQLATLAGAFTYTQPGASTSTTSSSSGSGSSSTPLSLSGVSPSQGPTSGGMAVTITGNGFQTGATVAFGTVQSTAVTVASSTQINAVSPAESAGTVSITVTGSNSQSASIPSAFTYVSGPSISAISPSSGPVTGGTTVTIQGSGFQSGASVAFGGTTAASVNFVSSSEIQAVTPVSSAGTVAIAVANPDAQTGSLGSAFTFYHTVSLAWTASQSIVSGYNVYRGSTPGGPYTKLNASLISGTSFSDDSVQPGQTYFYITTAVNNSVESAYSNQSQATVPSP